MRTIRSYFHCFKAMVILLGMTLCFVVGQGDLGLATKKILEGKQANNSVKSPLKSIHSEDGDIIDCIGIYKQPAFNHPAMRNHVVQMTPSYNPTAEEMSTSEQSSMTVTSQTWQKSGSCPKGTIPVRRTQNRWLMGHSKKQSKVYDDVKRSNSRKKSSLSVLQRNHSKSILLTGGYNYAGIKGDIKVDNPNVEFDDEYSASRISLRNGPHFDFECVETGWAVHPSLYGDRQTRFYVYWTVDAARETGCFDLTCPGFVQTNNEIALGAAIYPISIIGGLPYQITLFIYKDPETNNFWVQYGEKINIGYWPATLFTRLTHSGEFPEWGGDVYSPRIGRGPPHTRTAMGNGRFPDYTLNSGYVRRIRVLDISYNLKLPEWAINHDDEYWCYNSEYVVDYIDDPEFLFGGPGKNPSCP